MFNFGDRSEDDLSSVKNLIKNTYCGEGVQDRNISVSEDTPQGWFFEVKLDSGRTVTGYVRKESKEDE